MVLPANLMRITFNFTLDGGPNNGGDVAQPSLWYWTGPNASTDWEQTQLAIATAAYEAWVARFNTASFFPASLTLASVRCTRYDASLEALSIEEYAPGSTWHGTGASLPWQLTFCVGLYSFPPGSYTPHNRRKRGRFYFPPMTTSVLSDAARGTLSPENRDSILGQFRLLCDDLSGVEPPDITPAYGLYGPLTVSRVDGQIYQSDYVRADQVLDTQRRRTNSETKSVAVQTLTH